MRNCEEFWIVGIFDIFVVGEAPDVFGFCFFLSSTSAFSSFDESSHVIGLGLRRQVPSQGDYGSKQFVEEEATTMSTYVYRPKTLYRKDTNKMKKKEQFAHFPKKMHKERRRKKVVKVSMMEKEQEAALNRLLSIAGEDWSKVEKPDR